MKAPRFTRADAERANDEWGCNCGPGALAAVLHRTLDEVRPHLVGFDEKRYTNPTMMFGALRSLGAVWTCETPEKDRPTQLRWPDFGLARVQWEGPWTRPGVPVRARYRYTHWVGSCAGRFSHGVFDVNCLNNGTGWVERSEWIRDIVPHLAGSYRRATGGWHLTHAIELRRSSEVGAS